MRRLRNRKPIDRIENDLYAPRLSLLQRLARAFYFGILAALLVLGFRVWGEPLLRYKARGVVVGETIVVGVEHTARVADILIKAGDRVEKGQVVAHVTSQQVMETLTRSISELADQNARLAELERRKSRAAAVLPSAETQLSAAQTTLSAYQDLRRKGLASLSSWNEANSQAFTAEQTFEAVRADASRLDLEIAHITHTAQQLESMIARLRDSYNDGIVAAPVSGIVSDTPVHPGQVVTPGQSLVDIIAGEPEVLATVPLGTLYSLAANDPVKVYFGVSSWRGTIERIEPLSTNLPLPVSTVFERSERAQLVRIRLKDGGTPPPYHSAVTVTKELPAVVGQWLPWL